MNGLRLHSRVAGHDLFNRIQLLGMEAIIGMEIVLDSANDGQTQTESFSKIEHERSSEKKQKSNRTVQKMLKGRF